jgi:peroxiredoxin family protein
MRDEIPEMTREGVLQAVETQIRDKEPPETGKTLERLRKEGRERDEAIRLIACVLMDEMFHVMEQQRDFDRARYVQGLSRLPHLPWE